MTYNNTINCRFRIYCLCILVLNTIMPYTIRNKQKKKNFVVSHWSCLILYYVEYNISMLKINKNL